MKKDAVIIGYSGHAFVMLDILLQNGYIIKGYCENRAKENNPFNIQYLGSEEADDAFDVLKKTAVFVGIGDNQSRKRVSNILLGKGLILPKLVHPSAVISRTSQIDVASLVMPGVIINSMAKLGKGIICNSSSVIEHECEIGDYVHIAPGAVLAGNVKVGNNSFIGANSVVRQGVSIGENVIIGAGAVVTKNIESGQTVVGNPARIMRRKSA